MKTTAGGRRLNIAPLPKQAVHSGFGGVAEVFDIDALIKEHGLTWALRHKHVPVSAVLKLHDLASGLVMELINKVADAGIRDDLISLLGAYRAGALEPEDFKRNRALSAGKPETPETVARKMLDDLMNTGRGNANTLSAIQDYLDATGKQLDAVMPDIIRCFIAPVERCL